MDNADLELLKYPVGKFKFSEKVSKEELEDYKDVIAGFPEVLEETTKQLSLEDLSLAYRPEGWSVKQLVHHLADSHMNSFIRFKLSLTEDDPTIKPYFEAMWASMPDGVDDDISTSLGIINGVHQRWGIILESMADDDWARTYSHPEHGRKLRLDQTLELYAWHCNHHLAHIRMALDSSEN